MRPAVPWSVKGIEPEAREAAKQAAQRAGVTLGAWLNQMILEAGTDEIGRTPPQPIQPSGPQSYIPQPAPFDLTPMAETMRDVINRVENSERRSAELARRLEQSVSQLAARLDESERGADEGASYSGSQRQTLDPLERKIQQLAERLEEQERNRSAKRNPDDKAVQTLEKALNAVVDHLDATERRTDDSLTEIRQTLAKVAQRVDEREEEKEREAAEARARALDTNLQTMASRLEKMEQSVGSVSAQAVETALKAIADKSDADQHKATINSLQRSLAEITQRLERAEQRTDETLKTFERTVTSIARRLDDLDAPRAPAPDTTHIVENRLEQMADRLHDNEQMTLQAVQTIERAIAGMSDSLNVAENRSRETTESLHTMLERMTDRLGRLEKEAKAGLARPAQMLSPQVTVGQSPAINAGGGFVPGAQGFPIPNFDAPPMGGFGATPKADFRSPFANPVFPDATALPPAPPPSPAGVVPKGAAADTISDAPPPFANADDEPVAEAREPMDAEISNPVQESAHAAHDFLSAARRAAQAAAEAGGNPQHAGQSPYAGSHARFTAIGDERTGSGKRIFLGLLAVLILAAAGFAAFRHLNNKPIVPALDEQSKPAAVTVNPAPAAADKTPEASANAETAAPAAQEHPEATPDDAGAKAAAPASTTPAAAPEAAPQPAVESPIVPRPKKVQKQADTTIQRTEAKGPTLAASPAKPVATAPLADEATAEQGVPTGDRALRAAATRGEPAAQYEMGQRYANGEGVGADLSQAAYWYGQAANQGLAIAQYRLAALYEKGRGLAQDDAQARKWYEKAALQGNVKAMHNLAVIYAEGRGTRQDFTTAARWFGQAAELGLGDSQYNLAILQERGLGVPQDYASAYKWLSIAAKGGSFFLS